MINKIIKSFKNINHKLFISLLIMGLVPTIYTTIRVFWLGNYPSEYSYSIAGQLSWINLIYEVINEAIILPLFYFVGKVIDDKKELTNRMKTGLIITFGIYILLSIFIITCAKPLLNVMAADSSIIDDSVKYIRIEAIANIFGILQSFALVGLVTLGKEKLVYLLTGAKLVLCLIADTFMVSTLKCSLNLGVNGIGISNIIVNMILFIVTLLLLCKNNVNVFNKDKLDFTWTKDFAKIGAISGLESFVRNIAYMIMIARMVNVVSEQGTYWVANNFIWGWLLLPVTQLGELIKQEVATDKNKVKTNSLGYFAITMITVIVWCALIPVYKPFMKYVLNFSDIGKLFSLVMTLLGFYILYAIQNVFDSTFYGLGKTNYMLFESVITNSLYYGVAFILWKCGIWQPTLLSIALLFGIGNAFDSVVSFVAYWHLLKKEKINIFVHDNFVVVENGKIPRLHYEAQGFSHAFYIIYNSFTNNPGCQPWRNQGDVMSVIGTNGVFAIELYLKFLITVSTYDEKTFSGKHAKGHDLKKLYSDLKHINPKIVDKLESQYSNSSYAKKESFEKFLKSIKWQFEKWRYSYDSGELSINLNKLSDVLNILEHISIGEYTPVADDLAKNAPIPKNDNQSMTIQSDANIKSDFFC